MWVRNYPRGGGIELDVELYRRMTAESSRAVETLASAAPLVFRAQWSLLLEVSGASRVVFRSPGAPDLSPRHHPALQSLQHRPPGRPRVGLVAGLGGHHAVVAPIRSSELVIIARRGDRAFFAVRAGAVAYLIGALTSRISPTRRCPRRTPVWPTADQWRLPSTHARAT